MNSTPDFWRRCSACKNPIRFGEGYFVCSVSTCNRKRTGLLFCSMPCWSSHVPTMGHRDPWAEDRRAPSLEAWRREQEREAPAPREVAPAASSFAEASPAADRQEDLSSRRIIPRSDRPGREPRSPTIELHAGPDLPKDVLVVVSKLKAYIRARSGMNTSANVNDALSDIIRRCCDEAIRQAAANERKTVMGRDFAGLG